MANVSSFSGAMPVIPGGLVQVASVTRTSAYSVSANTVGTAADVFSTPLTFVANGADQYLIEFYCPHAASATTLNANANAWLTTGGSSEIGAIAVVGWGNGSAPIRCPVHTQYTYIPAAGVVTLNVRVTYGTATTSWTAGNAGGGGQTMPMMLRASRIVSQNDGLKPFWKPPIVTQLPTLAQVGDQVVYQFTGTNNVGALLLMQYNGTAWKPLGQATLCRWSSGSASQVINSTTVANMTNGDYNTVTFTPPWDGYYEIGINLHNVRLTSGIGLYVLFNSSTDTYSHSLAYFEDVNGDVYHTKIPVTGPRTEYLYAAQTYRWKAVITYASGNQGTIFSAGNAYVKAVA